LQREYRGAELGACALALVTTVVVGIFTGSS